MMNNKIAVTSDFGSMLITRHGNVRGSVTKNGLLLGHCESTKRGLFRKKTIQRPFTLSITEMLQHVVVYAEVGAGVDGWLMSLVHQAMRQTLALLYIDFLWSQSSIDWWSNVIPASFQPRVTDSNSDVAKMLTGNKVAYFCADNMTVSTLANAVSNLMAIGANDLRERPITLIILNGMPVDLESMEAVTNLLSPARAAKIGLILRLQERLDTDFHAMLEANARTQVEFMACGSCGKSTSLGTSELFAPCDHLGWKKATGNG